MAKNTLTPQKIVDNLTDLIQDAMDEHSEDSIEYGIFQETLDMVGTQQDLIDVATEVKKAKDAKMFDVLHNCYQTMIDKGYIGVPREYHKFLSDFQTGKIDINMVYESIVTEEDRLIIIQHVYNPEFNEQLCAYRHNYHYLTSKKGHDGINMSGDVFEAKNSAYKATGKKISPQLQFGPPSENILRKLTEGRPTVIANITFEHRLLFECTMDFTDEMIERYKTGVKNNIKGLFYFFKDYKHALIDISFIAPDFEEYTNMDKKFMADLQDLQTQNLYTSKVKLLGDYK